MSDQELGPIFLVIYCGYEGIQGVLWGGTDSGAAVSSIGEFRKKSEWVASLSDNDRFYGDKCDGDWPLMDNPDRFCVMSGGDGGFVCCCAALGVSPKEMVLF